ncbi:hypothetical protein ABKN59_008323 [Abortiporus biennis]
MFTTNPRVRRLEGGLLRSVSSPCRSVQTSCAYSNEFGITLSQELSEYLKMNFAECGIDSQYTATKETFLEVDEYYIAPIPPRRIGAPPPRLDGQTMGKTRGLSVLNAVTILKDPYEPSHLVSHLQSRIQVLRSLAASLQLQADMDGPHFVARTHPIIVLDLPRQGTTSTHYIAHSGPLILIFSA